MFGDQGRLLSRVFRAALHQRAVSTERRQCLECMGGGEINGVECRGCHGDRYVTAGPTGQAT